MSTTGVSVDAGAVTIDVGSHTTKIGYCGSKLPSFVIPTVWHPNISFSTHYLLSSSALERSVMKYSNLDLLKQIPS